LIFSVVRADCAQFLVRYQLVIEVAGCPKGVARLKITKVEVILTENKGFSSSFVWRKGLPGSDPVTTSGWLVIETDAGITGLASAPRGVILEDYVERRFRDELIGQDPLQREYLWERAWELDRIERFAPNMAHVVDVALWDIAGKTAKMPVYQLLGGFRESIPAYASTVTYSSIEEFLDIADQCLALGYPAIKLHAFGDARKDALLGQRLRAHVGDDIPLMYDGSAGFDLTDAVYLGNALYDAGFAWYEEPMREFSITAYKWLGERVKIPLLVGEVTDGAHMSAGDFAATGVASALRVSTFLRGGFTGAMRIAHLADAYHLRAEVHGMGLESAHLCMAIKNNTYYESLVWGNPTTREGMVDAQGSVHAPKGVGVGYETLWKENGAPKGLEKFVF
jgi:L-alanine-DL-glutamate epimerase-like enolase superfamily enzyme